MHHDLCFAWNWEYDADFAGVLTTTAEEQGVSLLQVTPSNLDATGEELRTGQTSFGTLFDRASDSDPHFLHLSTWAAEHNAANINPHHKAQRAWDKATMHLEFLSAGLVVPYTIILPPFSQQAELPSLDLAPLNGCFSIKPAGLGGGDGVVNHAHSFEQVQAARQEYPEHKYLLQAHVTPVAHGAHAPWFRVLYCCGETLPSWWDVDSHRYTPFGSGPESGHARSALVSLMARIAEVCGLGLFSTEVALTSSYELVAVDYVNEPPDLRLQSRAVDGVPDSIVEAIARRIVAVAAQTSRHRSA